MFDIFKFMSEVLKKFGFIQLSEENKENLPPKLDPFLGMNKQSEHKVSGFVEIPIRIERSLKTIVDGEEMKELNPGGIE